MCSTCGCGKKADTFEAPKRQRIGNRFISRRKDGTISKNVDVGRSLSADRRRKAKTTASAGQGDKGDLKRAESKFDKLSNEIAKDYEKKGKSKDEAEEIGKATAYKIGVAKYGKRGMERKARAGRAKNAESFEAERGNYELIPSVEIEGVGIVSEGSPYLKNNYNVKWDDYNIYDDDAAEVIFSIPANDSRMPLQEGELKLIEAMVYGFNHPLADASWGELNERGMFWAAKTMEELANYDPYEAEGFRDAESFGADEKKRSGMKIAPKIQMVNYQDVMTEKMKNQNMKDAESLGADEKKRSGMKIAPKIQMVNYQDVMTEKMKNQNMKDAESFGAETKMQGGVYKTTCDCGTVLKWDESNYAKDKDGKTIRHEPIEVERLDFPSPHFDHFEEELVIKCPTCGEYHTCEIEAPVYHDRLDVKFGADGYGEMVYVKRPHHVAYVRKEVAERPMDKGFEYPNMHTDQNKQGKIWDDRSGFRKMDSKERGLFEEIGGKISDFDVVGTTQDVVGKTGFNIPTGVASIAVVFMAYMTGKKYGN